MSTLNVSNITDGTDTVGTSYVVNGSAKAWVDYTSIGTVAIQISQNVSSLTDTGVGDIDVNLSSALASSRVALTLQIGDGSNGDQSFRQANGTASVLAVYQYNGSNATFDSNYCGVVAHGDLA